MKTLKALTITALGFAAFNIPVPAFAEVQTFSLEAVGYVTKDMMDTRWYRIGSPTKYEVFLNVDPATPVASLINQTDQSIAKNVRLTLGGKRMAVVPGTFSLQVHPAFGDTISIDVQPDAAQRQYFGKYPVKQLNLVLKFPKGHFEQYSTVGELLPTLKDFGDSESLIRAYLGKDKTQVAYLAALDMLTVLGLDGKEVTQGTGQIGTKLTAYHAQGWEENPSAYRAELLQVVDCEHIDFKSMEPVSRLELKGYPSGMWTEYFIKRSRDGKDVAVYWQDNRSKSHFCAFTTVVRK